MTDKTRAPRNSAPLTAHSAIGKIRAIYADQERRIAELKSADDEKARAIMARVDGTRESEALELMLTALCIHIAVPTMTAAEADDEPAVGDVVDDIPSRPAIEEYQADPLPAGARDYVPSAIAQAARRGR